MLTSTIRINEVFFSDITQLDKMASLRLMHNSQLADNYQRLCVVFTVSYTEVLINWALLIVNRERETITLDDLFSTNIQNGSLRR